MITFHRLNKFTETILYPQDQVYRNVYLNTDKNYPLCMSRMLFFDSHEPLEIRSFLFEEVGAL